MNNTSSTKNDVLLTLTQSLAALAKDVQSMKNHKTITLKTQIKQTIKQHLVMKFPFGRNRDGNPDNDGYADQIFRKERLTTPRRTSTRMRLLIPSVWVDL